MSVGWIRLFLSECFLRLLRLVVQLLVLLINNLLITCQNTTQDTAHIIADRSAIGQNWLFRIVTFSHLAMLVSQLRKQFSQAGRLVVHQYNRTFWLQCLLSVGVRAQCSLYRRFVIIWFSLLRTQRDSVAGKHTYNLRYFVKHFLQL